MDLESPWKLVSDLVVTTDLYVLRWSREKISSPVYLQSPFTSRFVINYSTSHTGVLGTCCRLLVLNPRIHMTIRKNNRLDIVTKCPDTILSIKLSLYWVFTFGDIGRGSFLSFKFLMIKHTPLTASNYRESFGTYVLMTSYTFDIFIKVSFVPLFPDWLTQVRSLNDTVVRLFTETYT